MQQHLRCACADAPSIPESPPIAQRTRSTSSASVSSETPLRSRRKRKLSAETSQPPKIDTQVPPVQEEKFRPSLQHMFYFVAAPTLCYQNSYPRTPRIRWRFVMRRLFELVFCFILMSFIIEQYIVPIVANSKQLIMHNELAALQILERILKLAVPNTAVWLLMFYAVFHSWLNLLAELLRFGDRYFDFQCVKNVC